MPRLKDNFQAGDPVAALPAGWLNQVARWLNNLQFTNGIVTHNWGNLIITPLGEFGGRGAASSFDVKATNVDGDPTKVTIRGGYIRYLGISKLAVADADVVISGSLIAPCVVAVQYNPVDNTGVIVVVPTEGDLTDSGSAWFKPLWEAYLTDGAAVISLDRRPDWLMGSPIR
jgi:hypothetical protein